MKAIDPTTIIHAYYPAGSAVCDLLVRHGEAVAAKALAVADHLGDPAVDRNFLYEAAMLHDIGIFLTDTPSLGCHGDHPYICHGTLGRELLERHGLERHALVCERHVGVGLSVDDIRSQKLPLPLRDMQPRTTEEEMICYADKFYSKKGPGEQTARPIDAIVAMLRRYGEAPARRFQTWARRFENGFPPQGQAG